MDITIIEFTPKDKHLLKRFVDFTSSLYKNDKYYVTPLKMSLIGNSLLFTTGLLTDKHPFHRHAEVKYILALRNNEILGRIAFCINHNYNQHHNAKIGSFGFFEVIKNYEVAKTLLDKGKKWLISKGMCEILGPLNFSTNETLGLLVEGFDTLPYINTPYNKSYYKDFIEKYGFVKDKDLIAQRLNLKTDAKTKTRDERISKIIDRARKTYKITTRALNLKSGFKDDIKLMRKLYLDAWQDNWGFVPMTEEEILVSAGDLKTIADKELIRFAYLENKAVGFIGLIPDINQLFGASKAFLSTSDYIRVLKLVLRKSKINRNRLMLFGILKQYQKIGVDAVLYYDCIKYMQRDNIFEECEASWILEDNTLTLRAGRVFNAISYKKWRIYSLKLN